MKLPVFFFLTLIFHISPFLVFAEEARRLDDIIVTATRIETPVEEVAGSVSIVTAQDIDEKKEPAVLDILRGLPGLDVTQSGGMGKSATISIRGTGPEQTLVMIDGFEANDVTQIGRQFDFSDLTVDNIERIEVVRGPQSMLYGSSAMGGAINMITKKGEGKPKFFLSGEGGSRNTYRKSAGSSGAINDFNYSVGISHINSDGISAANRKYRNTESDGYDNFTFSTRFGFKLAENMDTDFTVHYKKTRIDLDNDGGPGGDDINSRSRSRQLLLKGKVNASFFDGKWLQSLEYGTSSNNRSYSNPTDFQHPFDSGRSSYDGRLNRLGWQHVLELHKTNTVVLGLEYKEETGKSDNFWDSLWGPGSSPFPRETARNAGYYIQDQINLGGCFFGNIALRLDDNSRIGSNTTYRIAPAYLFKDLGTKIRGTYGTGAKAPSLYQLFAPGTAWGPIGNPNLKPEKSIGWDFGIDQELLKDTISLGITYFRNDFRNLIQFDNAQGYVNVGRSNTSGIEFSSKITAIDNFTFNFSYTYTDTEDESTGEAFLRRPKNKFSFETNYRFLEKGNINLRILYAGNRSDLAPFPTKRKIGGYTTVNGAVQYNITKELQVYGRVDNLFNKTYQEVWGYGTEGFSMYGGVKLSF